MTQDFAPGGGACPARRESVGDALCRSERASAVAALENATRSAPDDEQLPLTAAALCLQQGWHAQAAALALKASAIRPFHPPARNLLAEALVAGGRFELARRVLERTARMAPGFEPALRNLADLDAVMATGTRATRTIEPPPPCDGALSVQAVDSLLQERAPRLSVCLIVRDEEVLLPACLDSVRDVASQLIVVDTGSVDRTASVALARGASLRRIRWAEDFSAARNEALCAARGDWILFIDADERLEPGSGEALLEAIRDERALFHSIAIRSDGRRGSFLAPRLFRNAPGIRYAGRVNEQVRHVLEALARDWGLGSGQPPVVLRHLGYSAELVAKRGKLERDTRLLERTIAEDPGNTYARIKRARADINANRLEDALARLREILPLLPWKEAVEGKETYLEEPAVLEGYCLLHLGRNHELADLMATYHAACRPSLNTRYLEGVASLATGRPDRAAGFLRDALSLQDEPAHSVPLPEATGPEIHCSLGAALAGLGDVAAAADAYRAATALEPDHVEATVGLICLRMASGERSQAMRDLVDLARRRGEDPKVWLHGYRLITLDPTLARSALAWAEEAARRFPSHEGVLRAVADARSRFGG